MSESSESTDKSSTNEITEHHVKSALAADKGNTACLTSWTVKDFTKKGDNYISVVTSVEVTYTHQHKDHKTSYVVKITKDASAKGFNDMIQFASLMETKFYKELIPALNTELAAVGQPHLQYPHCYYATTENGQTIIFLEDLRARNFQMHSRHQSLDVIHVNLVLKELAKLHGASLLLQARTPQSPLHHQYPYLANAWFNITQGAKDTYVQFSSGHIENAKLTLEKVDGYSATVEWLQNLKSRVLECSEEASDNSPFIVLSHGDCWTNNFLFRYNDGGDPVEVMMLDVQLARMGSVANDLNYFMMISLEGSLRRTNRDAFLATYYGALSQVTGGLDLPFTLPQLHDEYRNKHDYGALMSMWLLPLIVAEDNETPSYRNITDEKAKEFLEQQKTNLLENLIKSPLFGPRILSVFDDLIDCDMIQSSKETK